MNTRNLILRILAGSHIKDRQKMKSLARIGIFLLALGIICHPQYLLATPFTVTFNWSDTFRIYGHQPVPQIDGFDYYFSTEQIGSQLVAQIINIQSIEVTGYGNNLGDVINFDWEVHLSSSGIGLPEGQFIQTLVDPVAGYERTAETQYRFVIGSAYDQNSYLFQGSYDFVSNSGTATPYLSLIKEAFTEEMVLSDGLHAQMFLWTADNRNCQIQFENLSLTVRGDATPVPEPSSIFLLGSGLIGLAGFRKLRRK